MDQKEKYIQDLRKEISTLQVNWPHSRTRMPGNRRTYNKTSQKQRTATLSKGYISLHYRSLTRFFRVLLFATVSNLTTIPNSHSSQLLTFFSTVWKN